MKIIETYGDFGGNRDFDFKLRLCLKSGDVRQFKVKTHDLKCKIEIWDHYSFGYIKKVGADYYARFENGDDVITYILQEGGRGFRLGPYAQQVSLNWAIVKKPLRLKPRDKSIVENVRKAD